MLLLILSLLSVGPSELNCRADAGTLTDLGPTSFIWRRDGGTRLECSPADLEPLDLRATDADPDSFSVRLQPARHVIVNTSSEGETVVEWHGATDRDVEPIARRVVELRHGAALAVAAAEDRVLRFTWPGSGSRTVEVRGDAVAVAPAAGAEVVATLSNRSVAPQRLTLVAKNGRAHDALFSSRGFVRVGDLDPGSYDAHAVYRGGIRRHLGTILIEQPDQTVRLSRERLPLVGGIAISLDELDCQSLPRGVPLPVTIAQWQDHHRIVRDAFAHDLCVLTFEGIAPGAYTVTLGTDPSVASEPLRVVADAITPYAATFEPTVLHGRVMINDEPAVAVNTLVEGRSFREVRKTDQDGTFTVRLPGPGKYAVEFRAGELSPGVRHVIEIPRGRHEREFRIGGGRLRVTVRGAGEAGELAAQVHLEGPETARTAIAPAPEREADFIGLEFGTYSVTASVAPDFTADPLIVTIDAVRPVQKVDVTVRRSEARILRLYGAYGEPAQNARVQVGHFVLTEQQPGTYEIPPAAGNRLVVSAPGYLPICYVLTDADRNLSFHLARGIFSAEILTSRIDGVTIAGLPNSTCPIAITALEMSSMREGGKYRIRIGNLPAGDFIVRSARGEILLRVPQQHAPELP